MKVYIGGRLVMPERWRTAWNPNSYKFTARIPKGQRTQLRIEWQPDGAVSYCGLRVAKARTEQEREQLSTCSEMSWEGRRVGQEGGSGCRSRWPPDQ